MPMVQMSQKYMCIVSFILSELQTCDHNSAHLKTTAIKAIIIVRGKVFQWTSGGGQATLNPHPVRMSTTVAVVFLKHSTLETGFV